MRIGKGPRLLLGAALTTALLGGCVYYNGMYNANRLARSAKKAERDGRTFEANNLWGQVATKAESVAVHHPTSKYAREARLLRGVALARMGQCDQAIGPLSQLSTVDPRTDLVEEALLATGRCQLAVGNLAASEAAFVQLLESRNQDRRREARFEHAQLLRQAGRYEEALKALEGIRDPPVEDERILDLGGAGRVSQAMALADSLIAKGDTTKPWDSLVVTLGRQNPAAASTLLDHMQQLPPRPPSIQAWRLVEDGIRLSHTDTARAAARFRAAVEVGHSNESARRAAFQLLLMDLSRARQPEDLVSIMKNLTDLSKGFEGGGEEATQLGATVAGVHGAATTVTWETRQGDLRLFLAAEAARDSLAAPVLAEGLFRRILEDFPNSDYAPKAVLAVQQLDTTWTDSARTLLEGLYANSPYLAMIRGDAPEAYRQLEDSLGAFAVSQAAAQRPAGVRRKPPPRDDLEVPKRRPPAPGTSRVPEQ